MAITYYRMGKYESTSNIIHKYLDLHLDINPRYIIGARVMAESILRKQGQMRKGRELLFPLLGNPKFENDIQYVYHTLGWNYISEGLYDEALQLLKKALPLRVSQLEKALTNLLIGSVYVEIDEDQKAQELFTQVKNDILNSNSIDSKMLWFERQLDLYWKCAQFNQIEILMREIKDLVDQGLFPERLQIELKNIVYKRVVPRMAVKYSEYAFFYNFLVI